MKVELTETQLQRIVNIARDGCYRAEDVCQRYQFDSEELERLVLAGELPKPIRIGKRHMRWTEDQLRSFEDKLAGRSYE